MSNTYTWVISQLEAYPTHEGQTDVVFTVHWRRQATDGTHNADIYGSQSITFNPADTFTPYAQLTQAEVEGWLEAAMGAEKVSELNAALDTQIANQINPPVVTPPLPWVA
jgi:hypothetical protein